MGLPYISGGSVQLVQGLWDIPVESHEVLPLLILLNEPLVNPTEEGAQPGWLLRLDRVNI